jgi:ubiquinone/menaquinone biosynthesis C-methylase UbiE
MEAYLSSGELHTGTMLEIVKASGFSLSAGNRVLDFGCAAGRMIRWLKDIAADCEVWGTDISAEHIMWCKQHLSPPFHFATTTTLPHLPFEDRYFDLIYAGSVFTHIEDLADAWLMELRRVLNTDGRLYVSIHDRNTIEVLKGQPDHWFSEAVRTNEQYAEYLKSDFGMFTVGRYAAAQVFYDVDYFCQMVGRLFKVMSVTKDAYGYQTAVLLAR